MNLIKAESITTRRERGCQISWGQRLRRAQLAPLLRLMVKITCLSMLQKLTKEAEKVKNYFSVQ